MAATVEDSDGVVFVPAFTGLGAPYWDANARGAIFGLHRGSTAAHIARAAIEAIAFQTAELLFAMQKDSPTPIIELRVDGGAASNDALLYNFKQILLGIPVIRPQDHRNNRTGCCLLGWITNGYL